MSAPLRYSIQFASSVSWIIRLKPRVVVVTDPPFVAVCAALCATRLVGGSVVADCHSGAFNDRRWSRFARIHNQMLRRCAGLIFHTQEMYELAREAVGVGPRWACVVAMFSMRTGRVNSPEDEVVRTGRVNHPENEVAVPAIVVPASYASDEPIHEILRAAALCPGIAFVFTGKAPPSVVAAAPANVVLTGWLSEAEYSKCVASCAAVLCLTTRSATMQNGLVEALEHGRPAIVSGTDTLRRLAEEIPGIMAIADHAPDTVARAVVTLTSDVQGWRARAASGFSVAAQRFERELADLRDHMALLSDGYGDRSTYRDTGAP